MICSKEELKLYLAEDLKRFDGRKPSFKDWILHNEVWYLFHYVRHLRYVEFYKHKNKILFLWHFLLYKRLGFKLKITIYPDTIGPGLRIYHTGGFIHVGKNVKIGKHCTILPGVVFGNKTEKPDSGFVVVGNNCYFGLGAKILGSLSIGNNAIIGANAVVTKDVPDNSVVGGVPAKILKIRKTING